MQRWILATCLLGLTFAATEELHVDYHLGDYTSTMTVTVDHDNEVIQYALPENDVFEEVEMLDDYASGYGATRVGSQDACFIQALNKTLEEQVEYIKDNQEFTVTDSANATAYPADDDLVQDLGSKLTEFCGGLTIYEMVYDEALREDRDDSSSESEESEESEEEESEEEESEEESQEEESEESLSEDEESEEDTTMSYNRQVSVTFYRCVLLFCKPVCYTTTLTVPTGRTITFGWLFWG